MQTKKMGLAAAGLVLTLTLGCGDDGSQTVPGSTGQAQTTSTQGATTATVTSLETTGSTSDSGTTATGGSDSEGSSTGSATSGPGFECDAPDEFPYEDQFAEVLGSNMRYVEAGEGDRTFLLLHGVPTHAYLWRDVIPTLEDSGRVIAVDLIGYGRSDKPDIDFTIPEQLQYLEGFIEALDLQDITLVVHDLGSVVGLSYAANYEDNLDGLVMMESLIPNLLPASAANCDPKAELDVECFWMFLRTPDGENAVLNTDLFLDLLGMATLCPPSDVAMAEYAAPWPDAESKRPLLHVGGDIPLDGAPADLEPLLDEYSAWLESSNLPKLLLQVEPGVLITPEVAQHAAENFPNLTTVHLGPGAHFIQETHGVAIAEEIGTWASRL